MFFTTFVINVTTLISSHNWLTKKNNCSSRIFKSVQLCKWKMKNAYNSDINLYASSNTVIISAEYFIFKNVTFSAFLFLRGHCGFSRLQRCWVSLGGGEAPCFNNDGVIPLLLAHIQLAKAWETMQFFWRVSQPSTRQREIKWRNGTASMISFHYQVEGFESDCFPWSFLFYFTDRYSNSCLSSTLYIVVLYSLEEHKETM